MRRIRVLFLLAHAGLSVLFFISTTQAALSGERFALLFGVAEYGFLDDLANPLNDMNAVARSLTEAGFQVTRVADPTHETASLEILSFIHRVQSVSEAARIDAVLFYFAGHALQHRAENYLLPSDFGPEVEGGGTLGAQPNFRGLLQFEHALQDRALQVNDVISAINQIGAETYIFIFDACRNSPIEGLVDSQGLSEIVAGPNNYVVFSATPGSVALDGNDGNSPFSRAGGTNLIPRHPDRGYHSRGSAGRLLRNRWLPASLGRIFTFVSLLLHPAWALRAQRATVEYLRARARALAAGAGRQLQQHSTSPLSPTVSKWGVRR